MTKNILLIGRKMDVIEHIQQQLQIPGLRLLGATNTDDVRSAFADSKVDHVIMGAGIDLETRLEIIREIFTASDATTVHMKDRLTGREGFPFFVEAVLRGLQDYEI